MSAIVIPIKAVLVPEPTVVQKIQEDWAQQFNPRGLSVEERAFLAVCQHLYRSDVGVNSPFEDFFATLVARCQFRGPLTPEEVEGLTDEFREHFTDFASDVRTFIGLYGTKVLS